MKNDTRLGDSIQAYVTSEGGGDPQQLLSGVTLTEAELSRLTACVDHLRGTVTSSGSGDPPQPDIQRGPGRFGKYELIEEIARGGMGVVYKAHQTDLKRVVALKMMLSGEFASERDRFRFQLEAEAAARLRHPNIVQVHDVGEHDGVPFFSMEYVSGGSLADRLKKRGKLSPKQASRLVTQVCSAISAAHDAGIVHRDLKPSNILLDDDGNALVSDFGLAKLSDRADDLTRTGQRIGTPAYMAPEQALGAKTQIGPLVDIYAIGGVLYALLAGHPPFTGDSINSIIQRVLFEEPKSIRAVDTSLPVDLDVICTKCLSKEPAARYLSAGKLNEELNCFLQDRPIQARPVSTFTKLLRWLRRNPEAARIAPGGYALFVGIALVLWYLTGMILYSFGVDPEVQHGRAIVELLFCQLLVAFPMAIAGIMAINGKKVGVAIGAVIFGSATAAMITLLFYEQALPEIQMNRAFRSNEGAFLPFYTLMLWIAGVGLTLHVWGFFSLFLSQSIRQDVT